MADVRGIAESIVSALKKVPYSQLQRILSSFEEYHGFEKVELPEEFLGGTLKEFGLTVREVEVDMVRVTKDLTDKVHSHIAPAYCIVLGNHTKVEKPLLASAYLGNRWFPVIEGDALNIPPLLDHGFTVEPGGMLYFLSVQSPRRQNGDGHDDWRQD